VSSDATPQQAERFGHEGRWWKPASGDAPPRHPPKLCCNCGQPKRSPTDLLCKACWSYVPAAIRVSYYDAIQEDFTSEDTQQILKQILNCAPPPDTLPTQP
jgi:hypothetical protein